VSNQCLRFRTFEECFLRTTSRALAEGIESTPDFSAEIVERKAAAIVMIQSLQRRLVARVKGQQEIIGQPFVVMHRAIPGPRQRDPVLVPVLARERVLHITQGRLGGSGWMRTLVSCAPGGAPARAAAILSRSATLLVDRDPFVKSRYGKRNWDPTLTTTM
jgi:hypothetical protein